LIAQNVALLSWQWADEIHFAMLSYGDASSDTDTATNVSGWVSLAENATTR
jgi:hypothetical protein